MVPCWCLERGGTRWNSSTGDAASGQRRVVGGPRRPWPRRVTERFQPRSYIVQTKVRAGEWRHRTVALFN